MATATSSSQRKERKHLTLKEKVEVIRKSDTNPKMTLRELAECFSCGKTQISGILKAKDDILTLYEANRSDTLQLTRKRARKSEFSEVNESLYEWYLLATSKNIYPNGPQLSEKAKEIAVKLKKEGFSASDGWLDKWKKRYNIKSKSVVGESGDVSSETVAAWKERLPVITAGYNKEDIYNLDETGCFWKALPDNGFGQRGKKCKGGKQSKQRFTIALIANAAGGKEKPIVIWKSNNPRCFRGMDKSSLPVTYFSQSKAWMTADIFNTILTSWNRKLRAKGRSILLLVDNAGCHPRDAQNKFSNIKLVYLPPNTTSEVQPLDLGIIQNTKVHYRKYFLRYVLSKIEECTNATEVAKSVDVLSAIRWIGKAWDEVKEETIQKCFRRAGVLDEDLNPVSINEDGVDPFADVDAQLQELVAQSMPRSESCSIEEYISGENSLSTCADFDSETWDTDFLESIDTHRNGDDDDEDNDEDDEEVPLPPPKLMNIRAAIDSLEDVKMFLEYHGLVHESSKVHSCIDSLALVALPGKQSDIRSYFRPV